jgi:hypothetical protein
MVYINFHFSATNLATLVAQGDIGQNELTGRKQPIFLAEKMLQVWRFECRAACESNYFSNKNLGTTAGGYTSSM